MIVEAIPPVMAAYAAEPATAECYGIVRVHTNDCASARHSCAGQSVHNGSQASFLLLPGGLSYE